MNIVVNVLPDLLNFTISIATLLVLYVILKHLLFKPVNEFLKKRQDYVENNLRESEKKLNESTALKSELEAKLSESKDEARNILSKARKDSEVILSEARNEAQKEKEKILQKAEDDSISMRQKAISSLKDEIIDIAIDVAKEVSASDVNAKKAKEFTDKKLNSLKDTKCQG